MRQLIILTLTTEFSVGEGVKNEIGVKKKKMMSSFKSEEYTRVFFFFFYSV